jgi:adenylate cyclase
MADSAGSARMEHGVDFGGFRFEPSSGRLWFGEREIRLTPKAAGVLATLVAQAGELVTKQELFASLWGDVAVSDDALTSCVQELRKALADNVKQPRFIETRHRRGYRFIAPLSGASPDESGAGLSRPMQTVARLPEREGKPTVVVLPFANMSGHADQEHFTDGITEDIITALAKHRSLLVIARGSAFAFKGRPVDVRQARLDLGADYIVEGSVVRSGQQLRISARLVETEVGRHVWAERYDRDVEAVFELRDEITTAIAARIAPEVGTAERQRTERKSPDAFRAWDFFHLGMKHLYKGTAEDNKEAQRLLQRAIDLDPDLAEAYGWLSYAIVLSMIYFDADPDDDRLHRSIALARKGVELDDQDALTHFTYGRALLAGRAYDDALAEFESAAELNPSLAMVYCGLGDSLAYEGRIGEAIPHFEKAISLSPFDPQRWAFYSYRALAHLFAGEFESAAEWSQKATRVPNCQYWPFAHRVSALGHLAKVDVLKTAKAELLERKPEFSCAFARRRLFFIKDPAQMDLYVEGLFKAGITA